MEITVIVPVKDRRDHIGKTLDTILKSGIPPKEVIIVDNESTDGTYQFCEQYIKNRPNVTLLRETFPGAAAARNKGLKSCKTEWVYFFDSDDDFDYNFISTFNRVTPDGFDVIAIPTKQTRGNKTSVRPFIPSEDPRVQVLGSVLNTPAMLFRTSYLKSIGGWNPACRIWDDWELGLRSLLKTSKVQWITEKAYHTILIHPDSLTGPDLSSRIERILTVLGIAFNDIHDLQPQNKRSFAALFYRCYILCGQMQQEGDAHAAGRIRTFIYDHFTVNKQSHQMGQLLEWGAKKGIRGMWKIALWLVDR
jgi:glycosyltransferase involved in cell wall biosynthesis